jgi:hypothetical protein
LRYAEQIERLYQQNPGFRAAVEILRGLAGSEARVLNFSHHDLDGISSAFILKRLLERLGVQVKTHMPQRFKLQPETLLETLSPAEGFDLLIISDKGTFRDYDELLTHVSPILIIDHHQLDGEPKECILFNPTVQNSEFAPATALLCNMLARKLGSCDPYDDFATLVGSRGDFAFDPVRRTAFDFVRPFLDHAGVLFPNLMEVRGGRPTMYDLVDRSRTALINQIGEVLQAGTLTHFYQELLGLDVTSGPQLVFDFLFEMVAEGVDPRKPRDLEGFLGSGSRGLILKRVYEQYKRDWEMLERRAEQLVFLGEARGVGIYLIFAKEAEATAGAPFPAILPFVVSTKLEVIKRKGRHPHAMVVVFCPKHGGVHVSMRGGGGILNCGKLCFEIARRLRARYPEYKGIGGGGHERAAELMADKPLPTYAVMHELLFTFEEILGLAEALDAGAPTSEQLRAAATLGLE